MLTQKLMETVAFIESKTAMKPEIALVLGSGLGYFADSLEEACIIPYGEIPHFVKTTAPDHSGNLVIGKVSGKTLLCMQGRFHFYEGYTMQEITYPVRVMQGLGMKKLILTNAAGGMGEGFREGDLMLISDHINFMGQNPLVGPNEEAFGKRFFDMTTAYDPELREKIRGAAAELGILLHEGIYVGFTGPSFETPAEIKMFQALGAHAVGMSTVPEVLVARHCGIRVAGISCITNLAAGISGGPISGEEVTEVAGAASGRFISLLEKSIAAF